MDHQSLFNGRETPVALVLRLHLPIQNTALICRAFTHRSYINEHPDALEDNERLEFLGDAVLDFIVGAWLYQRYPEMLEGDLTRMRSALVQSEQLADFARKVGIGGAIRMGKGEAAAGGRDRDSLLCDTFEALIGALYLDAGLEKVSEFIDPFLKEAADRLLVSHRLDDSKSLFQEWAQGQGLGSPNYITRSASGPDHSKVFEVDVVVGGSIYGSGTGASKQAAAKAAAHDALVKLGIIPGD
ncbi:MAG TPA: ribonuclease III [Anaerolineaceae bacterium]